MMKILVPSDFSFTAKQAYEFALQVQQRTNAEVHIVKAIDFPASLESSYTSGFYFNEAQLLKDLEDDARKSFEALTMGKGHHGVVHFFALKGAVSKVIQAYIENEKIDLVIMGTNGATGLKEALVGSHTERIVRFSTAPVIAVRQSVNLSTITDIVVPTEAAEVYPNFVSELKKLQRMMFSTLHFLLVSTDHKLLNSYQMMEKLETYARKCGFENYTLNIQREEKKEKAILEFTKEINADMIAMATHGRKGINHLFMGSLAEDVVNHASCPVWSYSIHSELAITGTGIVTEESNSGS